MYSFVFNSIYRVSQTCLEPSHEWFICRSKIPQRIPIPQVSRLNIEMQLLHNRLKNISSFARGADPRVTQAACIAIAIEPWILSS